jgi:hypothetical protein
MSKRTRRKRKPGRRVYYKTWSHARADKAPPKKEIMSEFAGLQRIKSEASIAARERKENHLTDAVLSTFGMAKAGDTKGRQEALSELTKFVRLENMDKHIVVHRGLRSVLILFYQGKGRSPWFVERNLLTGKVRRSIAYGTISQALSYSETGTIRFVE